MFSGLFLNHSFDEGDAEKYSDNEMHTKYKAAYNVLKSE